MDKNESAEEMPQIHNILHCMPIVKFILVIPLYKKKNKFWPQLEMETFYFQQQLSQQTCMAIVDFNTSKFSDISSYACIFEMQEWSRVVHIQHA